MTGNLHSSDISAIKKGTKVLFANFPGDGHFNPLTGLAVHLKNMGCDVRWYTSPYYREKIERMNIPFYGFKKAVDVGSHNDIDLSFPDRKNHKSQIAKLKFDLVHAFILRSPEYFEDLREIRKEFCFEVMIADITFGAIPFVREKMHVPVIAVSIVPLPETSKDLPPYGLGITPTSGIAGKIKHWVLRTLSNKMIFSKPTKIMGEILASYGIEAGKANIFDILIQKSTLVLQSGTPGFEYRRTDQSRHIHFAGPLLPHKKTNSGPKWFHEKLKQYDKVILVTQGTVEKDAEKLLVPSLEAFRNTDYLLVVTTGGSQTEELRQRYQEHNIIIEDFIPFDDIMPLADVYISNGGYGGVLLSIQHQLPMVVAGIHEGKNEINARVGYFKLGINLNTEKPTVKKLRQSVEAILANPAYTENVERLCREFNSYNPNEICARKLASLLVNNKRPVSITARPSLEKIY